MCLVLLSYLLVIPGDMGVDSEVGSLCSKSIRSAHIWDATYMSVDLARILAVSDDRHPLYICQEGSG